MFTGSIVAIVTPMTPDGDFDYQSLVKLIDFHCDNGTNAIVTVGTTGESSTVNVEEHVEILRATIELANGRVPVIAGTGANCTNEAVHLTQCAKNLGADACLLVTPYYNKPTQEGLYQHFKLIAESVEIPQILYNVPGRTSVDMLAPTVERLSKIANIIGIKEATGDIERAKEILQSCNNDFVVYSGDDMTAMECMLAGGKGTISVTANVAPSLMQKMCEQAVLGNRSEAERYNQALLPLHRDLFLETNPIPVKWALAEMGLIQHGIRLPLTELAPQYHDTIRLALKGILN